MTNARRVLARIRRLLSRCFRTCFGVSPKFACAVCGQSVEAFGQLPEYYIEKMTEAGWPYELDRLETCNVKQYSCPHCGAADRDRLMALYLQDYFCKLTSPARIIDFAPSAPLSAFIRREIASRDVKVEYRTADLMMAGVDDRVDITNMPSYSTDSVDLFLCSHVLEHIPDDRQAMRELYRILKPQRVGLILVPILIGIDQIDEDPSITDPLERWRRFGQDDHVRLYSRIGLIERLRGTGFVVRELGKSSFGGQRLVKQGISLQSVLYLVQK